MAHKKAGGSSRNGRDSAGRRLGVKNSAASTSFPAISLFANAAPNGTRATMSALAKITRFSLSSKAMYNFHKAAAVAPLSL